MAITRCTFNVHICDVKAYLLPKRSDRYPPRGRAQKFIMPKIAARLAALLIEKPNWDPRYGASTLSMANCKTANHTEEKAEPSSLCSIVYEKCREGHCRAASILSIEKCRGQNMASKELKK